MNMVTLVTVLFSFSLQAIQTPLVDLLLLAVSNILIFLIWYWIIDPPGVEDTRREEADAITTRHTYQHPDRFAGSAINILAGSS